MIPYNKPYITGNEKKYIDQAVKLGKLSGNGHFTQLCQSYLEKITGSNKTLLTTSCTDALEMAAILCNIQPGDEVIVPSYTFVSSALAFVRQGAKIVFADSRTDHPGIDESKIEELINPRTKAIVVVHYAGISCNMDLIMKLADIYSLYVIEDAAQGIDSYYINKQGTKKHLGSIGHLGCFSFHETKNIHCGEGGMLAINDPSMIKRAEIIWEKGTNRAEFFRGEINKYGWVDTGSSFLPSEILSAFLFAQLENLDDIQRKRRENWQHYYDNLTLLSNLNQLKLPFIPEYATNNAHMFYIICNSLSQRDHIIASLRKHSVMAVFHYQSLHKSEYYKNKHDGRILEQTDRYSECLLRLPLYPDLKEKDIILITDIIKTII